VPEEAGQARVGKVCGGPVARWRWRPMTTANRWPN